MCSSATRKPRVKPLTAAVVPIDNAACPRCDGPIFHCPTRWLFCPACQRSQQRRGRSPIPFKLANPTRLIVAAVS